MTAMVVAYSQGARPSSSISQGLGGRMSVVESGMPELQ
jgi:hypothetical protein